MTMENVILGAFISALILGFWCEFKCRRRMVPRASKLKGGFSPHYGRREDFTAEGWRYRNLLIISQVAAVCFALMFWLLM